MENYISGLYCILFVLLLVITSLVLFVSPLYWTEGLLEQAFVLVGVSLVCTGLCKGASKDA